MYAPSLRSTKRGSQKPQAVPEKDVFSKSDDVLGPKNWYGFQLPGHGARRHDCGDFFTVGCLEHGYIEKHVKSCMRADCPVCRQKWAGRLAGKAEHRMSQVYNQGPAKHITISVPQKDYGLVETDYPALRRKVYAIAKRTGVTGACQVFHPARRRCPRCGSVPDMGHTTCFSCGNLWFEWYFSPHFHLVGFGWIEGTGAEYLDSGYVVVNIGRRKSVAGTVLYILSHCGVHLDYHVLTWFGILSYNKLKAVPEVREGSKCPTCGYRLQPVIWLGDGPNPLEGFPEGEYLVDPDGWRYASRYR